MTHKLIKGLNNKFSGTNKITLLKFIVGVIILIPTTYYLLWFYIFTFYKAFFLGYDWLSSLFSPSIGDMLKMALETSLTELFCILCVPFSIMFLGIYIHFFTKQKSWKRYLKIITILCIVFLYDSICAYMIGKHMYEMDIIIGIADINTNYGFAEAFSNINVWVTIFVGFIAFVIWSIIFNAIISTYNSLSNTHI